MLLQERKVKIILHGYLKDLYEGSMELSGTTVAEIINGMCKFTKSFNVPFNKDKHVIEILGFEHRDSIFSPIPEDVKELHVMPAMTGGKKAGFAQIAIGVVLIAAAFFTAGGSLALLGTAITTGSGFAAGAASIMFGMGVSLILGGLISIMSPQPEIDSFGNSAADPEASKYLAAGGNTVRIGTRIPLIYGRVKVYGHYLSFNIDAKDIAV